MDENARIASIEESVRFHRTILEGGLDDDGVAREGLVSAFAIAVDKLDTMAGDMYGDGNGKVGIKAEMRDHKRERRQVIWWARAVGGLVASQLIAFAWHVFTYGGTG